MRFTCTTSKPPEPSPRSAACVLTTTSSPACAAPDEPDVGDRRARPAAGDVDDERAARGRPPARASTTVPAPQDEPLALRRVTRAQLVEQREGHVEHALQRATWLTRSVGSWLRSVPLARFTHVKPAGLERVGVRRRRR